MSKPSNSPSNSKVIRRPVRCWLKPRELRESVVERINGDIRGKLIYDPADPFAVRLRVPKRPGSTQLIDWVFARSLLDDGLVNCVDHPTGDVRVCLDLGDEVRIELSSPNGCAVLWLSAERVTNFLAASYNAVLPDSEADLIDWDRELAVFGGGPAGSEGSR